MMAAFVTGAGIARDKFAGADRAGLLEGLQALEDAAPLLPVGQASAAVAGAIDAVRDMLVEVTA